MLRIVNRFPLYVPFGAISVSAQSPGPAMDVPFSPGLALLTALPETERCLVTATQAAGATTVSGVVSLPARARLEVVAMTIDLLSHPKQAGMQNALCTITWCPNGTHTQLVTVVDALDTVAIQSVAPDSESSFRFSLPARYNGGVYAFFAKRGGNSMIVPERAILSSYLDSVSAVTADRTITVALTDLSTNGVDEGMTMQASVMSSSDPNFWLWLNEIVNPLCDPGIEP